VGTLKKHCACSIGIWGRVNGHINSLMTCCDSKVRTVVEHARSLGSTNFIICRTMLREGSTTTSGHIVTIFTEAVKVDMYVWNQR